MADDKPHLVKEQKKPIRVLLLDDREENLLLRSTILRRHGYEAIPTGSIEEAEGKLDEIDIAVLDYHLGRGKFGTDVATSLRQKRPQVPIIILSATLEHAFGGGLADMHLLKGSSSGKLSNRFLPGNQARFLSKNSAKYSLTYCQLPSRSRISRARSSPMAIAMRE